MPRRASSCVVDQDGIGVSGAVLRVGKSEIATDSQGLWLTREKRSQVLPLAILLEEFEQAGSWAVVRAPQSVQPGIPVNCEVSRK